MRPEEIYKQSKETEYTKVFLIEGRARVVRSTSVIGYCHYPRHKGFLTPSLLHSHECLKKNCSFLQKFEDNNYWRLIKKQEKEKEKKKEMKKDKEKLVREKREKEEKIKQFAESIAKERGWNVIFTSAKCENNRQCALFYVSDEEKLNYFTNQELTSRISHWFDIRCKLIHIKGMNGKYVTLSEWENLN